VICATPALALPLLVLELPARRVMSPCAHSVEFAESPSMAEPPVGVNNQC
jgi:hypothetical protein